MNHTDNHLLRRDKSSSLSQASRGILTSDVVATLSCPCVKVGDPLAPLDPYLNAARRPPGRQVGGVIFPAFRIKLTFVLYMQCWLNIITLPVFF